MLVLGERDVRQALDPQTCLDVNRRALTALARKTGVVPTRLALPYPNNPNRTTPADADDAPPSSLAPQDWTLIKPAAYYGESTGTEAGSKGQEGGGDDPDQAMAMGLKVVSVRAGNPAKGLPLVPATVFLLDPESGIVVATVAGTHLTVMRTSAGPALAVQAFQPDARELVVFGAGAQAECHIRLMELALRRRIPKITIINRTLQRAQALQAKLVQERRRIDGTAGDDAPYDTTKPSLVAAVALDDVDGVSRALATADVVAATTNSSTPLFTGSAMALPKGCLITSIGSYTPDMQEIPESVVDRSVVVIDTPEAMQVGDLKHLGGEDALFHPARSPGKQHPVFLAGDALADPARVQQVKSDEGKDYIFYKAVGTAIQDVLTAQAVLEKASEFGIGQNVEMS
jgi:ornithine cyclodeaminase